jgi:hypothetical protein
MRVFNRLLINNEYKIYLGGNDYRKSSTIKY